MSNMLPQSSPPSPVLASFLDSNTPEAQAHARISDNYYSWDESDILGGSVNESLMALAASYTALNRYLHGQDLYLLPRNVVELQAILLSYSTDAIHNFISHSRAPLRVGGYSRTVDMASKSIRALLHSNDNCMKLLELHQPARVIDANNPADMEKNSSQEVDAT